MRDGICPKCGSEEVYKKQSTSYLQIRLTWIRAVYPTNYVCANCGYYEWYIDNNAALEVIRNQWESANPKRKRKNNE